MQALERFQPHCVALHSWPDSYRRAWHAALTPQNLFEPTRLALAWRPTSLRKTRNGFGVWISWIQQRVAAPNWSRPEAMVRPDKVLEYVEELRVFCAPNTVACRIQELYDAVRMMAPAEDWNWLRRGMLRLRSAARPVRDKLLRLQPAPVLEKLGFDLMHQAEKDPTISMFKRALMFRDGLAIALMIRRPLRISTFSGLRCGVHLVGEPYRHLVISGCDMKNGRAFGAAFPENLHQPLERYLALYRPYLLSLRATTIALAEKGLPVEDEETALWISRKGHAIDPGAFSRSIAKRTREAFGRDLSPHLFRDAAVTTLVRKSPGSALLTKAILGHSSVDITNDNYNQAQMIESSSRYGALVEALTRNLEGD